MKFLVTGASGMIGSRLVEGLVQRYGTDSVIAVIGPSRESVEERRSARLTRLGVEQIPVNLLDRTNLKDILPPIDQVFHLAADLRTDVKDGRDGAPIRVNDLGTANLITDLAERLKGALFVYTSSIAAVDRSEPQSERLTEESPCCPRTLYGQTKLRGEQMVKEGSGRFGFRYVIFRLATVYGPQYRDGSIFDHLTRWVTSGALPARIRWPGKISLVYVDDVVDVLMSTVRHPAMEGHTFSLSNPEIVTVGEWITVMAEALGKDFKSLELPTWFVKCVTAMAFQNWLWRRLPYVFTFNAWRLSLILSNGLYCDSSKLDRIYPKTYLNVREGVRRAYRRDTPVDVGAAIEAATCTSP